MGKPVTHQGVEGWVTAGCCDTRRRRAESEEERDRQTDRHTDREREEEEGGERDIVIVSWNGLGA